MEAFSYFFLDSSSETAAGRHLSATTGTTVVFLPENSRTSQVVYLPEIRVRPKSWLSFFFSVHTVPHISWFKLEHENQEKHL